jgi:glutathione peroxidase
MLKILILSLCFFTSIYSLQFRDADGNQVNMSTYQNKKILIVNIATGSPKVNQLGALQQLQQTYGDSLSVIVFPSNSFGNEGRSDTEIKQFCQANYGTTFLIAAKGSILGAGAQPVFNWLAHSNENGVMDAVVVKDFQKFLIDKDGKLVGVFAPSVLPTDSTIINAINAN